jgi:hypothetical protein
MLHYPWRTPRPTHPSMHHKLTKPPDSLSGCNTSANRFKIFYIGPMPSTSNAMINTGCHINSRWATNFCCTCRKNTLQYPIRRLPHFGMGHTPSPRIWVAIILCSTFPLSLAFTQSSTWLSFNHISHHYWTPQR